MTKTATIKKNTPFARCIACNKVDTLAPFHWLALAIKDFTRAPLLSLIYGLIFSLIPVVILYVVYHSGTHLVILPATVAFALIGPAFAVGLYDIAWELEKKHKPTLPGTKAPPLAIKPSPPAAKLGAFAARPSPPASRAAKAADLASTTSAGSTGTRAPLRLPLPLLLDQDMDMLVTVLDTDMEDTLGLLPVLFLLLRTLMEL
jgi:hypothetical protein